MFLKGPEYQLTNAFPVIGEELVANLKHIEHEFNMYNELEKLGSCKDTCNVNMGECNLVRTSAPSQINVCDNDSWVSQSKMGEFNQVRTLDSVNTIGEANKTAVKPPIQYDVNKEFPLFKDLIDLCDEYPEVLNNGIGRYNGTDIQFKLETKEDALPVRHYPFKMLEDKRRVLREQIAVHIACGRIQPSQSAWASRAFLVSKKDAQTIDDWRLVIDYREVNDLSKLFPFPSPDSDYIMSSMAGAKYFSGMDIHSAFHQIPCSDEATIEKTAFVTPDGLYEWLVMPMGVSNGPAYQQALMHRIFGDMIGQGVHVFIDDIIIYAKTAQQHNAILRRVLDRLRLYGLTLKGSKCFFGQSEINYLGFIIGSDGIKPDPVKCDAIN